MACTYPEAGALFAQQHIPVSACAGWCCWCCHTIARNTAHSIFTLFTLLIRTQPSMLQTLSNQGSAAPVASAAAAGLPVAPPTPAPFTTLQRLPLAGGTLELVLWEASSTPTQQDRLLRIWTPPGRSSRGRHGSRHFSRGKVASSVFWDLAMRLI